MRRAALLLSLLCVASPVSAQISVPHTFVASTRIVSADVNANFSAIAADALNRTGGSMSGTLTTQAIAAGSNNTYDIGTSGSRYANIYSVLGNFSGTITSAAVIPGSNDAYALGSSGFRFSNTYSVLGNFSGQLTTAAVVPDGSGTRALGGSGARWSTVYSAFGDFSDSITVARTDAAVAFVKVSNTLANAGAYPEVRFENDQSVSAGRIIMLSSAYTSSGAYQADGLSIITDGAGGLNLVSSDTTSSLRLFGAQAATANLAVSATGLTMGGSYTAGVGASIYANYSAPTIVEAASGTHALLAGLYAQAPTITAGAASVTSAATLYVSGAPTASGATNYSLLVAGGLSSFAGQVAFSDGSVGTPSAYFSGDTNTGFYRSAADTIMLIGGGEDILSVARGTRGTATLVADTFGTGAVPGATMFIGRNSSGGTAAGNLALMDKNGNWGYLWVDAGGVLRGHSSPPLENGSVLDSDGIPIGTQTSMRQTKENIRPYAAEAGSLALLVGTPLYRFQYRGGAVQAYGGTDFLGVMADESPEFMMDPATPGAVGRVFNPISAFGHTVAAIKELERRLRLVESRGVQP